MALQNNLAGRIRLARHAASRHYSASIRSTFSQMRNSTGGASMATAVAKEAARLTHPLPRELPLFPVQPIGVFLPGMTKTLHLYEAHFVAMVEEALKADKLMATAVLEPFTGDAQQAAGLGAFVGGHNFALSCGCLVKVLDAKPYPGGYLVRIRGEARIGISNMVQVEPYMRISAYHLPDPAPPAEHMAFIEDRVAALDDVMRSVQNLASKFRCDETASIQQAFRYVNMEPLVPAVADAPSSSDTPSDSAASEGISATGQQSPHDSVASQQHGHGNTPDAAYGDNEEEPFDIQRAARLSYASLQWLPESTNEEKIQVLRGRLMAMEARSLAERVEICIATMDTARAQLAAKCALLSLGSQA